MKINILQGAFFPVPALRGSAIEKAWDVLGQSFADAGHKVTHISRKCDGLVGEEKIGNVLHKRIQGYDSVNNTLLLKFKELFYVLRAKRILSAADILITHAFWAPILMPKKKFGRIYVHVGRYPKGQLKYYTKAGCFQVPTNLIAKAVKDEISDQRKLISVLPYPLKWDVSTKENYLERDLKILYLGRIHPEKGISELIKAFKNIPQNIRKNWKLHIRGPWKTDQGGAGKTYLDSLKKLSLNSGSEIKFLEPLFSDSEIKKELETCRIFTYPSLAEKGETFGLSVLEAMSCGCVPIVSKLGCFKDFVEEGETGHFFDHENGCAVKSLTEVLVETLKTEGIKSNLVSSRCIEKAKEYEIGKVSQKYLDDFSRLISSRSY